MLNVGQRVVCVDDRREALDAYALETLPKRGSIYTIREIVPCKVFGFDEDALRLVEIVNPALEYLAPSGSVTHELAFRISRFRPVRTTSIDVFLEMLEPAGVDEVQAQALSAASA